VKYRDALVLLAKEEMVQQGMIDRLTETERCYWMEINMEESKGLRMSKESSPLQIIIDHKQQEDGDILTVWVAW
jgi:hypothetical protein